MEIKGFVKGGCTYIPVEDIKEMSNTKMIEVLKAIRDKYLLARKVNQILCVRWDASAKAFVENGYKPEKLIKYYQNMATLIRHYHKIPCLIKNAGNNKFLFIVNYKSPNVITIETDDFEATEDEVRGLCADIHKDKKHNSQRSYTWSKPVILAPFEMEYLLKIIENKGTGARIRRKIENAQRNGLYAYAEYNNIKLDDE